MYGGGGGGGGVQRFLSCSCRCAMRKVPLLTTSTYLANKSRWGELISSEGVGVLLVGVRERGGKILFLLHFDYIYTTNITHQNTWQVHGIKFVRESQHNHSQWLCIAKYLSLPGPALRQEVRNSPWRSCTWTADHRGGCGRPPAEGGRFFFGIVTIDFHLFSTVHKGIMNQIWL